VRLMVNVMHEAPGVGLAAPQIGVPLRLFVAEDLEQRIAELPAENRTVRGRVPLPLTVLINPSVVPEGTEQATFFEGCLSVRGYAALVPRWHKVAISGVDVDGNAVSLELTGWPARIMQHELDHLDGMLYVDRMLSRSFATEMEVSRLGAAPVEDVLRELDLPLSGVSNERLM
jgi:peptide deformylase